MGGAVRINERANDAASRALEEGPAHVWIFRWRSPAGRRFLWRRRGCGLGPRDRRTAQFPALDCGRVDPQGPDRPAGRAGGGLKSFTRPWKSAGGIYGLTAPRLGSWSLLGLFARNSVMRKSGHFPHV